MVEIQQAAIRRYVQANTIPAYSVTLQSSKRMAPDGSVSDKLYAEFQLRHRTAAWVIEQITEVIVTLVDDGFGIQFVYHDGFVDRNRLVVSADTYAQFMDMWRRVRAHDAEQLNLLR